MKWKFMGGAKAHRFNTLSFAHSHAYAHLETIIKFYFVNFTRIGHTCNPILDLASATNRW